MSNPITMPLEFVVTASRPFPLGVTPARQADQYAPDTVNVAVFAPGLTAVDVHHLGQDGQWHRTRLTEKSGGVHHGLVPRFPLGTRYGFLGPETAARMTGSHLMRRDDDGAPHSSVPSGLLLDPYGRGVDVVDGSLVSMRMHQDFDWGADRRPNTPWRDTVVYEAHVRGLTKLHPGIPEELRGTYAGLANPVMLDYLKELGVTAVELLPVHFHLDEAHLENVGLTNYWGYNTASFFAPHPDYATEAARAAGPGAVQDEFKGMVKLLHEAGIEVILDVVYNHTAEGGKDLPAQSFRGLGDGTYYRHDGNGNYYDTTGCGNSLNFGEPRVVQLVLDSLRHWVQDYHVDGFRFDLATTLCRDENNQFDPKHPFLVALAADPVFHEVKLISEPWDVGQGDSWQTGRFPFGWVDWNDRFRDTVRSFWLSERAAIDAGHQGRSVSALADVVSGSASLFAPSGRNRLASLNFITAHDGFTMRDLVSYDRKHNEANGENNRDGNDSNFSYNHGYEGRTEVESLLAERALTSRNLMTTLMVSLGVPMIVAGDELGRTQHGNNNAYNQDNAITWIDWTPTRESRQMLRATQRAIRIRREFMAAQPFDYPQRDEHSYLHWFNQDGEFMSGEDWNNPGQRLVQLLLGARKGKVDGLVVINGGPSDVEIVLPRLSELGITAAEDTAKFELRLSTSLVHDERRGTQRAEGEKDLVDAFSMNIYRL
ncbi:glycogen debranching protein GlgX [Arthrobacter sp. Y-9]|uniref:glycogen debranching protein GlgX n=1 Tax=Arthrobacter sp. Y-9 TaxID=3039385 RepID=UPI00241D73FE|nr:glycogen debranching protein GlgX [Arthrobacter sp. Y-9]WFR84633.1 glycogen debranching protein GlgX [Arthrobacter sp. Y-9]